MRIVIINKSDSKGGAAVVSRRLMEAFRQEGEDARMLVVDRSADYGGTDMSPDAGEIRLSGGEFRVAAGKWLIKWKFLIERLKIFIANGFDRDTLFKIDTGEEGLPLWKHPLVKEADAILINWVNQGMLSLKGFRKILKLGKPVIWTMHDMWEMTGICHHAGLCDHFKGECGECPLLHKKASPNDLSHKVWKKKLKLYSDKGLMKRAAFVAVSTWLKEKAEESSLLKGQKVEVIGNGFRLTGDGKSGMDHRSRRQTQTGNECGLPVRILFGAARLDDPIKGLDTLKETAAILKKEYPETAGRLEIAMFGAVKNPEALDGFELPLVKLGVLHGEEAVRKAYESSDIVVSASSYETLPGTLVEAQAYGCLPVSFNQGGQKDIIDNGVTGFITEYSENKTERALNLAHGIIAAVKVIDNPVRHKEMLRIMRESVCMKFSYYEIARKYISLINKL